MPVEFLTDGQAEAYGKFVEEPTQPQLERPSSWTTWTGICSRCGVPSITSWGSRFRCARLGMWGLFLGEDPLDMPWPVVEHLAGQLDVEDPSCVKRYTDRRQTVYDQAWEIREAYDYHL